MRSSEKREVGGLDQRYRLPLMAYFMRRSTTHSDAEDLTQEVFARLSNAPANGLRNPDAYIFQMAANLLRDRGRRERVRNNYDEAAGDPSDIEPLDPSRYLLAREELNEVTLLLQELPETTRTIFLLFRLENISQADLAAHYRMSVRAVQKHIHKAMTHVLSRLGEGAR